jgi:AcrR family transcriptional regulator
MQPNERLLDETEGDYRPAAGGRREQIVREAAELFAVRGYHGTSMQDIAERVGMLKGSLYAHVANKEEILLEIVSTTARVFTATVEPIAHGGSAHGARLREALRAHLAVIAENRASATVFLVEWRHLEGQPLRWFAEARGRYEALWQGMLAEGLAAGAFPRGLEPRMTTRLLLAAAGGACQWLADPTGPTSDVIADSLADLFLGRPRD